MKQVLMMGVLLHITGISADRGAFNTAVGEANAAWLSATPTAASADFVTPTRAKTMKMTKYKLFHLIIC